MNFGTKLRTVLIIATSINTALMATDVTSFNNETVNLIYRILTLATNFVVVAVGFWYNNDYTAEACEGTGYTRMLKAMNAEDNGADTDGSVIDEEEGDE